MSAPTADRRRDAEGLRGFFEVQLRFAELVAPRFAESLERACLEFTNLHWRLGLGVADFAAPSPGWLDYARGLRACEGLAERGDWTVAFFQTVTPVETVQRRFGCFRFEVLAEEPEVVRIHFNNLDSGGDVGPLARAKLEARLADLRAMFAAVRAEHPEARRVRGSSWLYNLEAYRRLFPQAYVASAVRPDRVRLNGTSSWGQVFDFRGAMKPEVCAALLRNAADPALEAPCVAFPMRPLAVESAVEDFYALYGI